MDIKKDLKDIFNIDVLSSLLNFFKYSIEDISSYEELTREEKNIISKKVFNFLTKND